MDENVIANAVIGAAIEVHRALGPGLLESVYQQCLVRELELRDMPVRSEVPVRACYKGLLFDAAYRMDVVVDDRLVIELKVVERLLPVHEAQLLSYLRLTNMRLGLLMNFQCATLRDGLKRVVNKL